MDRIDIHIEVPSVETQKLLGESTSKSESSEVIQKRVQKARERQLKRFAGTALKSNSEMGTKEVRKYCPLSPECRTILRSAVVNLNLSARSYFKVIKVARTIADLADKDDIDTVCLAEALQYRLRDED